MTVPTKYTFVKNELIDLSFTATLDPGVDTDFPFSNAYSNHPGRVFKFSGIASTAIILFDFGVSPQAFNAIGVINHNIPTGYEMHIQANATDDWSDPSVEETITHREISTCKLFDNSTRYRYWRFRIREAGGFILDGGVGAAIPDASLLAPDDDAGTFGSGEGVGETIVTIGELVLGSVIEAPINPEYGDVQKTRYQNRRQESEYGSPIVYPIQPVESLEMSWEPSLTDAQLATIEDFWNDRKGDAKPFMMVPDPGTTWHPTSHATVCYFGFFVEFAPRKIFYNVNALRARFEEFPNGKYLT